MGISSTSNSWRPGVIANASARPSNPFEGQVVYQTDTNQTLVWDGAAWVDLSTGKAGPSGLVKIVPTGATNGTVGTNGDVAIGSAVSSVTVTGAFSADYDNYLITVTGGVGSTGSQLNVRLGSRVSNYKYQLVYGAFANTPLGFGSSTATSFEFAGYTTTSELGAHFHLYTPYLSQRTRIEGLYTATGGGESGHMSGLIDANDSYTSFIILVSSGTITGGTIRVYGYNQ